MGATGESIARAAPAPCAQGAASGNRQSRARAASRFWVTAAKSEGARATQPERAPAGGGDQQWQELLERCDTLQLAVRIAWEALLEAYKPSPDGFVNPPPELLERYYKASALRQAAELALFSYTHQRERMSGD